MPQHTQTPVSTSNNAFELHELVGYRMARLSASIGNLAEHEAMETAGLTLPEYRVLVVLDTSGPCGVTALQNLMRIDKAWISRSLAKLVEKSLAVSNMDAYDGRRSIYKVTSAGHAAAQALINRALARQKTIYAGFSIEEKMQIDTLLERLQHNVDQALSCKEKPNKP